jgi:hypothetical protein
VGKKLPFLIRNYIIKPRCLDCLRPQEWAAALRRAGSRRRRVWAVSRRRWRRRRRVWEEED